MVELGSGVRSLMKVVTLASILLSVALLKQTAAHCPYRSVNVLRESRLVHGEDNRTVELLVACHDGYALLQPTTGGLRVQEINIFSTCIDPTTKTPEVDPTTTTTTIVNEFGTSGVSRIITVSAELGMECHYFGCYEKSITGIEAQLYYTFTTATCNWGPSSNSISPTDTTEVLPSTSHPSESSYALLLPFQSSSTLSHNGLHTSVSAHFDASLQPSPSLASINLHPTPIHSLPVIISATQDKDITSSTSVLTTVEAFTESLTSTPSIPYSTTNGSLVTFWAFPLSVLGLLIIVAAALVAACYTLKVRHNRCISDQYTDQVLTVLKVDKLDPYFNPIGFDVISVHSDGTDYSYGNRTQNELQLVLQATYLGSHMAELSTTDRSSCYTTSSNTGTKQVGMSPSNPENKSNTSIQFSSISSSDISNSIPSTDPVQPNGDNTRVAFTAAEFSQEGEVHTHDIQIKNTVQLSTERAATPLQLHIATSTSDDPCGLQQDSSAAEYLTEEQVLQFSPFQLAELESDAIDKLDESNGLDTQAISNRSEYVPNDFFDNDVSA